MITTIICIVIGMYLGYKICDIDETELGLFFGGICGVITSIK
jgi:hypothetical protein